MGLFNRGFKPNVSRNGQPPANGDLPAEGALPPAQPQARPEPAIPEEPAPERAVPEQVAPERDAPLDSPADHAPRAEPAARATSAPPVNPAPPDHSDEDRISASEALAPTRRPGSSRPPGAAIGDESERRAKIISFANQKGGVAKTTTTLNLAVAFDESGHDVLAVDLDPQGNLTMSQGIDPDKVDGSMYDVLVDHVPIREVIHEREIDIAVASIDLAG